MVPKIEELSAALRGGTISVSDWRNGLDDLLSRVALEDLLLAIDFDALAKSVGFAKVGVATTKIKFTDHRTRRLTFYPKLFAIDRGRAIIPHGHANMVSAHMPLRGRLSLRQYDQLHRDGQSLTIRPTIEREIGAGDLSSIGEDSDNVHWFIASEPAHTFDVIVTGIDESAPKRYEIFNLDMERAEDLGDGAMRVPRIPVDVALRKYG